MEKEKKVDIGTNREEDYSEKGNHRSDVMSYIVCVIAAIFIWLLIMNMGEPTNIPLSVDAGTENILLSAVVDYE